MKKLLLYSLGVSTFLSLFAIGDTFKKPVPPPPTYVEVDTVMSVSATKSFKFRYCAPSNLVSKDGVDSAEQLIVDYQGAGEATSDQYGDGSLTRYGILDYKHAGWDGGIVLGNGTHYNNIYVHVSQQPPYGTNATGWQWNIDFVKKLAQRFRVRTVTVRGIKKKSIGLVGLSAGGDVLKSMIIYDTLFARDYITCIWSVEGVYPDATPVSNLAAAARNGVRAFFTDGGNDSWNQSAQRTTMNGGVANSADYYITTSGEAMWGHGSWNYVFGGDGDNTNRTPKIFPGTAFASGIAQTGWQWMARQTDTTFFSASTNPVAQAGPDQVLFQKASVTLDGSASAAGTYPISSYSWSKISGPGTTSIPNPNNATVTATGLQQGVYVFRLTVTDANGGQATDDVQVTIQGPPTITPGPNQQVNSTSATMAASATDEGTIVKRLVQILQVPGQPFVKIGFVGSSTAFGYGVSSDSTIEYILNQQLQQLGLTNTKIDNRGVTSTDFWNGLWTNTPYPGTIGHAPDTSKNVTALYNSGCKLVINLFTTNSLDNPSVTYPVLLDAYKKMRDSCVAHGMKYLQITPKTRDGFSPTEEQKLHDIADSLLKDMPNETIDVWHGFTASPNSTATRPEIDRGDGVHWNGAGHVQAVKQIVVKIAQALREMYPTSTTVTTPSSFTTTVTGMASGTYTMLVSAKDNDSLWNSATMTITDTAVSSPTTNCRVGTIVKKTLSLTGTREIYLPNGGQGIDTMKGRDEIHIPAGGYDVISLGNLNGSNGCKIKIVFDGPVWVKIFRIGENRSAPVTNFYLAGQNLLHIGDSAIYQNGTVPGNASSNGLAISYAKNFKVDSFIVRKTLVGAYIKPIVNPSNPLTWNTGWEMDSVEISYFDIQDILGEGIYAGDTYPNADPYAGGSVPARLNHVEIHHGYVNGTDWDGIQLSNARSGAKIHDNTVLNVGRINMGGQQAGIILGGNTTGDVYNNIVRFGTGNGIQSFGYGTINIYGNTIEACGYDGTANGQQSYFGNDFISTVETNPNKKVNFHDNIIIHPKYLIGILRENADNGVTDSVYYKDNQFCFDVAPGSWATTYLMSAATATVRSGNTSISCGNNQAPTAAAGVDQFVILPVNFTILTGVGIDLDGSIASYSWTKTSGGSATITNPSSAITTVTGLAEGTYVFTLIVTDNLGATASDDVTVVVKPVPVHFYKQNLQSKIKQ